jgi:type VI secretion system secreted protein Hcp
MRKRITAAAVATALLVSVLPADAAMMAYAYIKGARSGPIKGSVTQKGREDSIGVIAFTHDVKTPTDPTTGAATGKRQHGVFKITKELDKSTPLLYNSWAINENLSEVTFKFWSPNLKGGMGGGTEVQNYTVKLTNAHIVNIKSELPNVRVPELMKLEQQEEVSFTYQRIDWTWNEGGITANDSAPGG